MLNEFYFLNPLWLMSMFFVIAWFLFTRLKPLQLPKIIQPIRIYYPLLMALSYQHHKDKSQNTRLWLSIIMILLCLSLAQPAFKVAIKNTLSEKQNVDLILVVNTSVSMVLRDYKEADANGVLKQVDRMTKTKQVLKQLVTQFKGKHIALVVLGRPAAIWLPLTGDMNQVLHAIDQLQTTLGGRSSDIGATLQLVSKQFNQATKQQKTVLLVNDGYLQTGSIPPIEGIKQLVNNHFIVHTLAIGSPKQPEFSLGVGHLIYSPVDLKLMNTLAKAGKGSMVHAWQNKPVKELLNIINQPSAKISNSQTQFKNNALYFYPLSLAMLMLLLMAFPINRLSMAKQS